MAWQGVSETEGKEERHSKREKDEMHSRREKQEMHSKDPDALHEEPSSHVDARTIQLKVMLGICMQLELILDVNPN